MEFLVIIMETAVETIVKLMDLQVQLLLRELLRVERVRQAQEIMQHQEQEDQEVEGEHLTHNQQVKASQLRVQVVVQDKLSIDFYE
jgi:hypothetical protein